MFALTVQATVDANYLMQIWQTTDAGATWLALADFYADTPAAVMTLPLDPVEQPVLIGVGNRLIKLYRQSENLSWAVEQHFLADTLRITGIVTTESYLEDRFIHVTTNDGIYQTMEGGATWTPVAAALAGRTIVALLSSAAGLPVYAVELGGAIWQAVGSGC